MSNNRKETSSDSALEFDLSYALQVVSQQGETQAVELMEKQLVLKSVQATFSEILKSFDSVASNIKLKELEISGIICETEQIRRHNETQETQMILMENIKLKHTNEEQMENLHSLLAGYNTYRNKMEGYKMSVSVLESQSTIHKELMEMREEVKRLREYKKELILDLMNPEGNTVKQAQEDIDAVMEKIHHTKELVGRKRILWKKQKETHLQLREDIAIQNRRCEAIVKRLRCQLNKAQFSQRQLNSDIFHMEKAVEDLRSQVYQSIS